DFIAAQFHRKNLDIIGKLIKRPASAQIEARRVPVASKDAVTASAAVERKAHMRAAIIQSIDLPIRAPEHQRTPGNVDSFAATLIEIAQACDALPVRLCCLRERL